MALSRLGDYIEQMDIRNTDNSFDVSDLRGISINKIFTPTKANTNNLDLHNYKIVKTNWFAYCTVTSRNGNKISIAYNDDRDCIISSINPVFRIKDENCLLPRYLMMFFNRDEFDRYARFNSWGSARETFSWDDLCDMKIDIPNISIQKKYVAIYDGLLKNLYACEKGLSDLKFTCEAYIEDIRRNNKSVTLDSYITETSIKNDAEKITLVQGVDSTGLFCDTKANMSGIDISKYKVVERKNFAYNPSRINLGSIAIRTGDTCVVSPMYQVFKVRDENVLNPNYLNIWLHRTEFLRSTLFYAVGSVRDTFDMNLMKEVRIPIPDIEIQNNIAELYLTWQKKRETVKFIKFVISSICPILIRGSVLEAQGDVR